MEHNTKKARWLSALMAACMSLCVAPMTAFATDAEPSEPTKTVVTVEQYAGGAELYGKTAEELAEGSTLKLVEDYTGYWDARQKYPPREMCPAGNVSGRDHDPSC